MRTSIPLYHHLKNELIRQVEDGAWQPGELIPSELELARKHDVSRTTVRQAVGDLVSMGYLVRQQGKGTFVASQTKSLAISTLYGFAEELLQKGHSIEVHVHEIQFVDCPEVVAEALDVNQRQVIRIYRTGTVDGACVFHDTSYLLPPANFTERELHEEQFEHVYGFFERHGVKIGSGKQAIAVEPATGQDRKVLTLAVGEPVLAVRRITRDVTGLAVEFSEVRYRASFYAFEVNLHRQERM